MIRNFPSIEDGAASCVEKGADTVLLIPYFLHTGLHLIEDLPNAVPRLHKLHPGVRFVLGQPMGLHPGLIDIVSDQIKECKLATEQEITTQGDAIPQRGKHLTDDSDPQVVHLPTLSVVAAAKVAAQALKTQRNVWQVEVLSEAGERIRLPVNRCETNADTARSAVALGGDGDDDEDQLEVYAEIHRKETPGVSVVLSEGIEAMIAPADRPSLVRELETVSAEALGPSLADRGVRLRVLAPWRGDASSTYQRL